MNGEVSVKLIGGLANNMFQLSCAHAYAKRYDKIIIIDDSVLGAHKNIENYKTNILSNINFIKSKNFSDFKVYNETTFHYAEIPQLDNNVLLSGYFQSEKYFKDYEQEIRQLFSFPIEWIQTMQNKHTSILQDEKICSIHVRRGDYLTLPDHHPAVSLNYIMKAVRQFPEEYKFIVFSDDQEWCKKNLMGDKFIFTEPQTDVEDLWLMTQCKNNIIANSSFSWWGAWLNPNPDKKVIAPTKWFGKSYANNNTIDLIPETWTQI